MMPLGEGLIGWLSPKGIFHECKYNEHSTKIQQLLAIKSADAQDKGWINITSYNCEGSGVIGIYEKPTNIQIEWLLQNISKFDADQINTLNESREFFKF
ncbi:hypothetical protein [Bacillus wiedmannii]|uniref:hypothetical protein n=1 Tax=Bacillus wiedmannii TaxID=1890302 RepID=UPI002E21F6F8|nr:hypothetical protein [Bacillus wiedmannii]